MNRRTSGNNQTLERIVEAAVRSFSRQGFNGSTTREIARLAGVNEVTLFRYFSTKRQLFWAALERCLNLVRLDHELQSRLASDQDEDPEKAVEMIFEFLVGVMLRNPELVRLMNISMLELGSGSDRVCRKKLGPVFEAITAYLERCAQRGLIRSVDPFVTALGFVGMVMAHQTMYQVLTGVDLPYRNLDDSISAYTNFWVGALTPVVPRASTPTRRAFSAAGQD